MFMIVASSRHILIQIVHDPEVRLVPRRCGKRTSSLVPMGFGSPIPLRLSAPAGRQPLLTVPKKTRLTCYSAVDFDAELVSWGGWRSGWQLAGLDRLCVDGTLRYPLPLGALGTLTANVSRGGAASRLTHCDLRVAVA
jgi:hypothetical protein